MHYFNPKRLPAFRAASELGSDHYDGAELRRNPGIPEGRFRAYELPSLRLGQRVTPRQTMAREGETE
jgi:hypothetical protein